LKEVRVEKIQLKMPDGSIGGPEVQVFINPDSIKEIPPSREYRAILHDKTTYMWISHYITHRDAFKSLYLTGEHITYLVDITSRGPLIHTVQRVSENGDQARASNTCNMTELNRYGNIHGCPRQKEQS